MLIQFTSFSLLFSIRPVVVQIVFTNFFRTLKVFRSFIHYYYFCTARSEFMESLYFFHIFSCHLLFTYELREEKRKIICKASKLWESLGIGEYLNHLSLAWCEFLLLNDWSTSINMLIFSFKFVLDFILDNSIGNTNLRTKSLSFWNSFNLNIIFLVLVKFWLKLDKNFIASWYN